MSSLQIVGGFTGLCIFGWAAGWLARKPLHRKIKSLMSTLQGWQEISNEAEKDLKASRKEVAVLQRIFLASVATEVLTELVSVFKNNPSLWADPPPSVDAKIAIIEDTIPYKSFNQLLGEIDVVVTIFNTDIFDALSLGEDSAERALLNLAKDILEQVRTILSADPLGNSYQADNLQRFKALKILWRKHLQACAKGEKFPVIGIRKT